MERKTISNEGLEFIKEFEGFREKAYKAVSTEKYYTIGYGHYGKDVSKGQVISKEEATTLLRLDIKNAENAVNSLARNLSQCEFDALVSFTYNCGSANLRKLCAGRTNSVIAEKILLYNKAGGVTLKGLVRRRERERKIFLGKGYV